MHIPNLKRTAELYRVAGVCTRTGLSARSAARRFDGCREYTDYGELLQSDIDMVLIATRHDTHADLAVKALEAGVAVLVEKPMCISNGEYEFLRRAVEACTAPFMVAYNRRFSQFTERIKARIHDRINPLIIQYTMNAGYVPYSAWVHTEEGGGRIVGEACHIFDLFRCLVGHPAVSVSVDAITPATASVRPDDNAVVTVKYADGSVATLLYTAIGSKKAAKEVMQVFCDERVFEVHDYKTLKSYGDQANLALNRQDKGHLKELQVFAQAIRSGERFPIPWEELKETWEITRKVADELRTRAN
jgi:predicted dehydrogenase